MAEIEGVPGWSVEWPISSVSGAGLVESRHPPGMPGKSRALVAAGEGYEWDALAMTADEMDAFAQALTTAARAMREQHP